MGGGGRVAGSQPISTAVQKSHALGVQINFGDLTPYLTYAWPRWPKSVCKFRSNICTVFPKLALNPGDHNRARTCKCLWGPGIDSKE